MVLVEYAGLSLLLALFEAVITWHSVTRIVTDKIKIFIHDPSRIIGTLLSLS